MRACCVAASCNERVTSAALVHAGVLCRNDASLRNVCRRLLRLLQLLLRVRRRETNWRSSYTPVHTSHLLFTPPIHTSYSHLQLVALLLHLAQLLAPLLGTQV